MYTTRIKWEPLRTVDSSTLTGVYVPLGGPLLHPGYIVKMVNNSNVLVTVSIDGITDVDVCPANSYWLYDEDEGNQQHEGLPAGTQIMINGAAGVGSIYLVVQYIVTN